MKSHKPHAIMIVVIVFFLSGIGSAAADATPEDDAYHYMKNGVDDQLYNEWWYFNGADNETQFMIIFLLSDPENLTSSRKIQAQAVVLQDGQPPLLGSHQSRGFGGDRNSPMFDIDQNGFSSEQEPNLKVWGVVNDETSGEPIKWDLVYQPTSNPWFAIPVQERVGHIKGGWMKWLVYMPSASVTGTLTIGNRTLGINGTGYHDHIWGRFALNDPQFIWAEAAVPGDGFSLSFRDIPGEQQDAFIGIEKDGETITFSGRQVESDYTDYAFDNTTAAVYPAGYHVAAKNRGFSLDMAVAVQESVPTLGDYPSPLPDYLAFHQVSLLQGTLRSRSGEEYRFQEQGFSGYATQRLHPIFGRLESLDLSGSNASTNATINTITNATTNVTINATNERTGQVKTARIVSGGFFSVDANYSDYLADSTNPWVADGDKVRLEMGHGGHSNSTILSIDLSTDRQEAGL